MKRFRIRSDILLKSLDATVGRLLCLLLGYGDYLRSGGRSPAAASAALKISGKRILVIRPGGLGDMILLLPALHVLAQSFPDAVIDLLCENRNAAVLPLSGFNGRILHYDRDRWRLWRRLRGRRYDIVVDTEQFHHLSAVIARLTGASCRIGFKINPVRNLLYTHLVNYALDAPESAQFMRLLTPFGLSDRSPSLDGMLTDAVSRLEPPPVAPVRDAVAVYAAASTPYKQWPIECFKQLITFIVEELELSVVLIGGKEAAPVSHRLAAVFKGRAESAQTVVTMAGRASLLETAAMLRQSRFFVGTDCGLTHLAVAVGVPTVTLFGPSDPLKWGHPPPRHQVLHQGLSCSPCFIFGYHRLCRTHDCMTAITVDDAIAACRRAI